MITGVQSPISGLTSFHRYEYDAYRFGTISGSCGYVHPVVSRVIVPDASTNQGDRVWKHVHECHIHSNSCRFLLLYIYHFGCNYWYSYTYLIIALS
ncbi:hypothetical protein QVD17_04576 [Tagetes erecta]|uniref:Uncharacterized protein n=1 Tax=Tagetes erecta TaxID=13708 RepID=A0AAD8PAT7_TARER|nr:hypothetical protein QVD17_04576 [Tagetes erecta]